MMFDLLREPSAERKVLRPHQALAIEMIRASLGKGNRSVVIQMPTGAGKTVTAARIIEGAVAKGNRVIFTAPAISLIDQTVAAFEADGITGIGVMQANHPRTNPMARVQVASVQTLARRDIPSAALVIVDECHIRSEAIDHLMAARPDVFFVGLSATPWAKGMGLRWRDVVIPVTIGDLIEAGHLSRFTCYAPYVPDLRGVKVQNGDFVASSLEAVMGNAALLGNVVNTWLEKGEHRPTLCFAVNRAHAAQLASSFERNGIASAYVDAMTDRIERGLIGDRFRAGEVKVICSVRTMTTGVDLPVSCVIDAAPTKSEMLHVQKIGRGLRVNPGTEDCLILDHAGNSLRLGLVTDIHHGSLDTSERGGRQERNAKAEKLPRPCPACGALHTGATCPVCGHERRPVANVRVQDGELVEVSGRKAAPTMADRQAFWSMALHLDQQRGRGGKLAKALYRGKFGAWPNGLSSKTRTPDRAFMNYEKSRRIAYAKSMARQRGVSA